MKRSFPFYRQPDAKDCGPTCLRIVAKHYGKLISLQEISMNQELLGTADIITEDLSIAERLFFKFRSVQRFE
nr:cysteine peptidase family C39 domain-containing protein [Belliella baltica]